MKKVSRILCRIIFVLFAASLVIITYVGIQKGFLIKPNNTYEIDWLSDFFIEEEK